VTGQSPGKPTVAELGIDPAAQVWHRSGNGDGALEVAFAHAADADPEGAAAADADPEGAAPAGRAAPVGPVASAHRAEWVLMRVAGDPEQRVLVFDRHEWECFLDGARKGEFDDAAAGH
jgi:hypothetical protein